MTVVIAKSAIDLGIVMRDAGAMTRFYGETLGLPKEGEMEMPGGVVMHRYQCGETVIKLLAPASTPEASNPPGGLGGGTGIRYLTISVSNLDEAEAECKAAGSNIVISGREIRPGVRICMMEDPDGNWVELLQQG